MSSATVTVLSGVSQLIQFDQLNDLGIFVKNFTGELMEELAQTNEDLGPRQFVRFYDRLSVGIEATRELSPSTDFFSVSAGMSTMASVQA